MLASLLAVGITQFAKQQSWSKQRTQAVATGIAGVLGLLAAIVLGLITGIPDSIIQIVSSILLSMAAVAVLGRALYGVLGYVIPDGTTEQPAPSGDVHVTVNAVEDPEAIARAVIARTRGRRADRDGVPDGWDTPAAGTSTFTNTSGRPETVLTADQAEQVRRIADAERNDDA